MKNGDRNDDLQILRGNASYAAFEPKTSAPESAPLTLVERERPRGSLYEPPPGSSRWRRPLLLIAGVGVLGLTIGLGFDPDLRRSLRDRAQLPAAMKVTEVQESVLIEVAVRPSHARLYIDGEPAHSNPIRVIKDGRLHRVLAVADGYKPGELVVSAEIDQRLKLNLRKRGTGK